MDNPLLIILIMLMGIVSGLFFLLFKKKSSTAASGGDQLFLLLQNQIQELSRLMDQKMSEANKSISQNQQHLHQTIQLQFGESSKIISEVSQRLTKLDATNQQVMGFADQLQSLQQVLQNPKQRGILGEYYLENVLKNVLPPGSYQMQYPFANGDIVDAVVFVKEKIIPIDSKFSLENYNRVVGESDAEQKSIYEIQFRNDLKKRIDETSKYIKPNEGTMDFAFMFIPAEGIYYDLLVNKVGALKVNTQALIEYAFKEKHVIIVSPTSFLAYLQTVLQGLRSLQIEESAKEIRGRIEELGRHITAYDSYFKKVGTNLATTVNAYNAAYKELNKIDKDVVKITGSEKKIEASLVDKPALDLASD